MSERLSPRMRMALRAIVDDPDQFPRDYPGGMRTVRALQRRDLVHVEEIRRYEDGQAYVELHVRPSGKGVAWNANHEHAFKFAAHADGCHWWVTTAVCDCGAVLRQTAERDIQADPYAVVWFSDDCERCDELAHGAAPDESSDVTLPERVPA